MNAIKFFINNLQVYLQPELYISILVVMYLLACSFMYSFCFFKRDNRHVNAITRVLCGNIVLINIGLILLAIHLISPVAILCATLVPAVIIAVARGVDLTYLTQQFRFNDKIYTITCFIIFALLLPKIANGFLRWDEMSYHLAYPQYWINNGGLAIDYSMRYPVYSFGMHAIYTLLMVLGNVATVKLFNGFFLLFFMIGIAEVVRYFQMPRFFSYLFLATLLIADYFNSLTFSSLLEPSLWTYAFFITIEALKIAGGFNEVIDQKRYSVFLPFILLAATAITIKNFVLVYIVLYMGLVTVSYLLSGGRELVSLVRLYLYTLGIIFLLNTVVFAICFIYSGDPLFPLFTMNFPNKFQKVWHLQDINGLKESVNHRPGFLAKFHPDMTPHFLLICLLTYIIISAVALMRKDVRRSGLAALIVWLFITMFITQLLFPLPGNLRYSFFLMPGFLIAVGFSWKYWGKVQALITYSVIVLVICQTDLRACFGKYTVPVSTRNINDISLVKVTYGDAPQIQLLTYIHENKSIDTIGVCDLAAFKYLMLRDKKVVVGDDIGPNSYDKICSCKKGLNYIAVPLSGNYDVSGCHEIYKNAAYAIYQSKP